MKKTFYMMRHGQTLFNLRRKIQGACDSPLTALGIQQAEAARDALDGIPFTHYYASTAERCSDTLEIVKNNDKPYTRVKGLKEMNFGTFEGESEDLNPKSELFEDFFLDYGGESRGQVKERTRIAGLEIMNNPDHDIVLAVSHAGACLHFMRNWETEERIAPELKKGFSNCCIFKYSFDTETQLFSLEEVIRPTMPTV